MDPTAVSTIAQGTLVTSAISAFVTGLNGIWRRYPNYGILAGAAAMNSGLTAFTFFGIREFAISPLLVSSLSTKEYQRRRRALEPLSSDISEQSPVSWGDLRRQKLLDSAVSGALTAGSLRALKTGPKGILSGAVAGAAVCAILQYSYNEIGVQRLKYITRPQSSQSKPTTPADDNTPVFERVLSSLGIDRVPDDKYLIMLKDRREKHLRRIQELEAQIAQEESLGTDEEQLK
ncbi:hypothetical protein PC9H_000992 [Pleurotus ostreatus]|uniref:Transmembrane protein n=1 Tax=Pleurotus ostreatus TaxID=5322 RepID=A0A8H7DXC4_PLEOS|nr:uncharacterized protein PC9H_000992 [Pleurotus ostreatus]KAF7440645.1 hypothetical protein PC9H_000992 [Pleurotus ostreatus]